MHSSKTAALATALVLIAAGLLGVTCTPEPHPVPVEVFLPLATLSLADLLRYRKR